MTEGKDQARLNKSLLYKSAGFYMLRAPTLSANTFTLIANGVCGGMRSMRSMRSMSDDQADLESRLAEARQESYDVLKILSADPVILHALMVASADLFEGLERIQRGDISSRRIERVYSGILRYLVRMSTRPTPFGLFSGVAMGTLGEQTTAQIGVPAVKGTRTRPDMGWLLSIIQRIEEDYALVPQLNVVANRNAYIAGARAIIPYADVYGKGDNRSIAIRATTVVQYVMQRAQEPVPYHVLRQDIFAAFPLATEQQVDGFLRQLWENHFLTSDLRPPLTGADPEKYVLERLQSVPQAAAMTVAMEKIVKNAAEIDRLGPGAAVSHLRNLVVQQQGMVSDQKQQPFQVDAALNLEAPQLSLEIGEAVADTAEVLLQMTSSPSGPQYLREYYMAFIEHYGMEAEVPLLDLLSPEIGLGAPSSYTEPPRDYPLPPLVPPGTGTQARDSILCSILGEALYKQKREIELTDSLLQALKQWTPKPENPLLPTIEMYLQLHATSREAIERGEWRGVIAPMGMAYGGKTFCRFFDMLGEDGLEMLQEYTRREEQMFPDTIFAELSYLPIFGRGANVAIRPALRSYEITLNTTPSVPPDHVISLQDLVVGVREECFYIRSLSRKKEVIVTQSHMLNTTRAPNICRFMLEVALHGKPMPSSFDWGAARNAPYLPRVVRKKMVLSPAQWNIHLSMIKLAGSGSEEVRFFRGLQQWREQWHVPRYVYMAQFDNRLLLDLEHPLLVAELYEELKKTAENSSVTLQEMLPDFEHLWLRNKQNEPYFAELVVPLIMNVNSEAQGQGTNADIKAAQKWQKEYPLHPISDHERNFLPGDEWIYLKLYVTRKQQDEVIAGPLRDIVRSMQEQQLINNWFFIRYSDPEPHLRVRFHARDEHTRNTALINALAWGRQMVQNGLIRNVALDTYARETERYGGPKAIETIERIFTANSMAASEIVAAMYTGNITLDPLVVAVFTLDQFFAMWGLDVSGRLAYIQPHTGKHDAKEAFRPLNRLLCELLAPWDPAYDPSVKAQREQLHQLCLIQEQSLKQASSHIKILAEKGELWMSEQQILRSLAHMHFNRLSGTLQEEEGTGYAFWRHTLESISRRPTQKGEKGTRKHQQAPSAHTI